MALTIIHVFAPLALPFNTIAIAITITNIVILIIAIILFYRSLRSSS